MNDDCKKLYRYFGVKQYGYPYPIDLQIQLQCFLKEPKCSV